MSKHELSPWGSIRAMRLLIDKGAERYEPNRHLERLLGAHADDPDAAIARLKRALRSQRRLGRAGHWSYDLNRHFGLLQALKAEQARARAQARAEAVDNAGASMASGASDTGTETS